MNFNFKLGQTASLSKKFETKDIEDYARITGDNNPIHLDSDFA